MARRDVMKYTRRTGLGVLLCAAFLFAACAPSSKTAYLQGYEAFIDKTQAEADSYTESDWLKADKTFAKFSSVWYEKFEAELTVVEKMTAAGYGVAYNALRFVEDLGL